MKSPPRWLFLLEQGGQLGVVDCGSLTGTALLAFEADLGHFVAVVTFVLHQEINLSRLRNLAFANRVEIYANLYESGTIDAWLHELVIATAAEKLVPFHERSELLLRDLISSQGSISHSWTKSCG
jgi:hypothetical protein